MTDFKKFLEFISIQCPSNKAINSGSFPNDNKYKIVLENICRGLFTYL